VNLDRPHDTAAVLNTGYDIDVSTRFSIVSFWTRNQNPPSSRHYAIGWLNHHGQIALRSGFVDCWNSLSITNWELGYGLDDQEFESR